MNNDWTEQIIAGISSGHKYNGLLNYCVSFMPKKKLYKYYSLDSAYTLPNLQNDIIYLSNPSSFNDPLDCNIGLSADSIIKTVFPQLLKLAGIKMEENAYRILAGLLFGNVNRDSPEKAEYSVISEMLEDPQLAKWFLHPECGGLKSEEQLLSFLDNNPELFGRLVRCYYGGQLSGVSESDINSIISYVASSPRAIRNLIDNSPNITKDDRSILWEGGKDGDILQKIIELATMFGISYEKKAVNDLKNLLDTTTQKIHLELGPHCGVSCFSERSDNMLMWAHYANKHTGICVEYDFGRLCSGNQNSMLLPVIYTQLRPILSLENMMKWDAGKVSFEIHNESFLISELLYALRTKSNIWEYENEWRLIKRIETDDNRTVHLPLISAIYTGVNFNITKLKELEKIAIEKDVPLMRYRLKSDRYDLCLE